MIRGRRRRWDPVDWFLIIYGIIIVLTILGAIWLVMYSGVT